MKIHTSLNDVKDQLISFISEGYGILGEAFKNPYNSSIPTMRQVWESKVMNYLDGVFPTKKESGQFLHTPYSSNSYSRMEVHIADAVDGVHKGVEVLESILDKLEKYYQFEPESLGVDIQHIDSFEKVRGVNHRDIDKYVNNGFFDKEEDTIIRAFAEIIGESYVPNHWPGENEDLYTSRILFNGQRVQSSIAFNGPGKVPAKETRLNDLGARGNQLLKMMRITSSKLYILQSVKYVSQDIIDTFEIQVRDQRRNGHHCYYCIIDGQDTATILYAYGYLS